METMVQMIGDFGLAVSLCLGFAFFIYKIFQWNREDSKAREQQNLDTITRLSGILSENSRALLKNSEVMDKISEKIDNIDVKIEEVKTDVTEIKIRQQQNTKGE